MITYSIAKIYWFSVNLKDIHIYKDSETENTDKTDRVLGKI